MTDRYPLLTELVCCAFNECFPGPEVDLYMKPPERWDWSKVYEPDLMEELLQQMDPDSRLDLCNGHDDADPTEGKLLFGFSCWVLSPTNDFARIPT